jgi:hypothetical protein
MSAIFNRLLFLGIILSCLFLVPHVSAQTNFTYSFVMPVQNGIDINSSFFMGWLPFLINATNTNTSVELPVIAIASSICAPFTSAFEGLGGKGTGNIYFLILIGIYFLSAWKNSGTVTIPSIIFVIVAGGIGMLIDPMYQIWITLLCACAVAANLLLFLVKE